jgi:hypothetical protein
VSFLADAGDIAEITEEIIDLSDLKVAGHLEIDY